MLFVVHATENGSAVQVVLQQAHKILGRLEMGHEEWQGFRKVMGSGVVGASLDGISVRMIDETR